MAKDDDKKDVDKIEDDESPKKVPTKAEKKVASEKMVAKARENDKANMKREADAKDRGEDPDEGMEKTPKARDLKKFKMGRAYSFKANHGRVKHDGVLYEREDTFEAPMDKAFMELCKKGILIPNEI